MSIWKTRTIELLSSANYLVKAEVAPPITAIYLYKHSISDSIGQIYHQLGGIGDWSLINMPNIDIWAGDAYLMVDDHLQFNRYRATTLKSAIYERSKAVPIEAYARYCRQYEAECRKAGLAGKQWTNKEAEQHYGPSAEEGEYFGQGSAGWKLRAFQAFLLDCAMIAQNQPYFRLSLYSNLMVAGQILRLDKILLSKEEAHKKAILQWLGRTIGPPSPQ